MTDLVPHQLPAQFFITVELLTVPKLSKMNSISKTATIVNFGLISELLRQEMQFCILRSYTPYRASSQPLEEFHASCPVGSKHSLAK